MWFDTRLKLAEIEGGPNPALEADPIATSATTATQAPAERHMSQKSRVSQPREDRKAAPNVARVAAPETFPRGLSAGGRPLTFTGQVVSLDAWRALSEWEKHGPKG